MGRGVEEDGSGGVEEDGIISKSTVLGAESKHSSYVCLGVSDTPTPTPTPLGSGPPLLMHNIS